MAHQEFPSHDDLSRSADENPSTCGGAPAEIFPGQVVAASICGWHSHSIANRFRPQVNSVKLGSHNEFTFPTAVYSVVNILRLKPFRLFPRLNHQFCLYESPDALRNERRWRNLGISDHGAL